MYARVEIKGHERFLFEVPQNIDIEINRYAICKHEQGLDIGLVLNVYPNEFEESVGTILRKASEDDMRLKRAYEIKEQNSFNPTLKMIKDNNLDIKLVDISIHFDGQRMTFYFISEKRVDFRSLVKSLASHFHTRIRMKQIGVRDYARRLDGIGPCGQKQCCTRFLSNFEAISLQILKDQNLSMTPQKVSGMCGRLMCCLMYEIDFYEEANKKFPALYSRITTSKYGEGTITKINIYKDEITIQYDNVEENGGVLMHTLIEFNKIKQKKFSYVPPKNTKFEKKENKE